MWSSDPGSFDVLARGPWSPGEIALAWEPEPVEFPPAARARIDARWEVALAEARARGRMLWAGGLAALQDHRVVEGGLELSLRAADYRMHVGTHLSSDYLALPRGEAPRAESLGISALPRSSDGFFVLQRRSELNWDCPGYLDIAGGHTDPERDVARDDDLPARHRTRAAPGVPCPVRGALAEVEEELGIAPADVVSIRALALLRARGPDKPCLIFLAEVSLPSDEIARRALLARDRREREPELLLVRDEPSTISAILRDEKMTAGVTSALELARGVVLAAHPR